MSTTWTPERRAKQAELINRWKPWEQATGPRSLEGKEQVSKNARTGDHRTQLRELTKLVSTEIRQSRELVSNATDSAGFGISYQKSSWGPSA